MNQRAVGCGLLAAVAFVAMGLYALSLAFERSTGCTPLLAWGGVEYRASGAPTAVARLPSGADAERIGEAQVGLTTRTVYGPPGSAASPGGAPSGSGPLSAPAELVLDCADGTFQGYERGSGVPTSRWWVATA